MTSFPNEEAIPDILETGEAEAEASARVSTHARHHVAAAHNRKVGLFVKRAMPFALNEFLLFMFVQHGNALRSGIICLVGVVKVQTTFGRNHLTFFDAEQLNHIGFARHQLVRDFGEILVGYIFIIIVELSLVFRFERVQPTSMDVIRRDCQFKLPDKEKVAIHLFYFFSWRKNDTCQGLV